MAEHSFFKRNWKMLLNIITLIALIILVALIWEQIVATFNNLKSVNLWVISLMIPLLILNYHAQAKMYLGLFKLMGSSGFTYKRMLRAAVELNFINRVFPSAGVSGVSYFGMRMRSDTVTGGRATMVQIMKFVLVFMSFEVLLIVGLLLLALSGQVNNVVILMASSISTLLFVGTAAFIAIIGSEKRIRATFRALTKGLNRAIYAVRHKEAETFRVARAEQMVQELHNNFALLSKDYRNLKQPFLWATAINLSEILSIYAVYAAFGEWVNLGAIIIAYAVANFAGLVAVLPGGIGVYEGLMTGVLAASGIPARLSLPVTVMFRVLSTAMQAIPGYYFYHKAVKEAGKSLSDPAVKL